MVVLKLKSKQVANDYRLVYTGKLKDRYDSVLIAFTIPEQQRLCFYDSDKFYLPICNTTFFAVLKKQPMLKKFRLSISSTYGFVTPFPITKTMVNGPTNYENFILQHLYLPNASSIHHENYPINEYNERYSFPYALRNGPKALAKYIETTCAAQYGTSMNPSWTLAEEGYYQLSKFGSKICFGAQLTLPERIKITDDYYEDEVVIDATVNTIVRRFFESSFNAEITPGYSFPYRHFDKDRYHLRIVDYLERLENTSLEILNDLYWNDSSLYKTNKFKGNTTFYDLIKLFRFIDSK